MKTASMSAAFAGLVVLPITAIAQSSDLHAQRRSKVEQCFIGLVKAATANPDLTTIPDVVSVPLGLGKSYVTRQASFDDADGQHAIAVSSTTPDKLLFMHVGNIWARLFVTSRTGDIISGGTLESGVFKISNDRDFRTFGEAEVRLFLTHAYPSGNCAAAYFPRH